MRGEGFGMTANVGEARKCDPPHACGFERRSYPTFPSLTSCAALFPLAPRP